MNGSLMPVICVFLTNAFFASLPLRLAEVLHDEADGERREVHGVAGLVDGG